MLGIRSGHAYQPVTPHHRRDPKEAAAPPSRAAPEGWEAPVLGAVAATGEGVPALAAALERHAAYLETSGQLVQRRRARLAARTRAVLERAVRRWLTEATHPHELLAQRLHEASDRRMSAHPRPPRRPHQ